MHPKVSLATEPGGKVDTLLPFSMTSPPLDSPSSKGGIRNLFCWASSSVTRCLWESVGSRVGWRDTGSVSCTRSLEEGHP